MESQPNVMEIFQALKSDDLDFIKSLYTLDSKKDPIFSYIPNPSIPLIFRNNSPLLSVASFYGSHQCIDYLLQISSTIDIKDASKFPMTPLHYAIAGNKLKTVKHLLSLHSSPIGILYFSIIFDRIKILQYSLENQIEPIDSKFNGETALSTSRDIGNSLFIALLIANGAEDVVSIQSQPLKNVNKTKEIAADSGDLESFRNILSEGKISINALTSNGDTPLMFAARRGSLPIVKFILQHEGVDVNQANKGGKTPLHLAALRAKYDVVQFLLSCKGINPIAKTIHGRNALHCAAIRCKTDIIDLLLNTHQLHPNQQDNKGDTPLHIAVYNENIEVIHRFLEVPGVKFNIRNVGGRAAFDLCSHPFLVQFRPKMNEIIAEARKRIKQIKLEKKEQRRLRREQMNKEKQNENV